MLMSRRLFLAGAGGLALATTLNPRLAIAASDRKVLRLAKRQIEVGGKAATRYGVSIDGSFEGLFLNEGQDLDVRLENGLDVPSGLHWHGLDPPWRQDGVPYISGPPILPGKFVDYKFPAVPTGTRWMHSHFGLQEQNLLAAPLIIREKSAIEAGLQEIVIILADFSWTDPQTIFDNLRNPPKQNAMGSMGAMDAAAKPPKADAMGSMGGGDMGAKPDLNDIEYDAFLANDRTLDDPAVFDVERGAEVRLRIINSGASTNFTIDLGPVEGTLITVDGNPIVPLKAKTFPLAIAQRADILIRMPSDGSAVPVLARGEGRRMQAGVILRPPGAAVAKIPTEADSEGPVVGLEQELLLRASAPLATRPVDASVPVGLTGVMTGYIWGMTVFGLGGAPVTVQRGQLVELVMQNQTMMAHPMHLHGRSFQVTEIEGKPVQGAVRDTVLVPPKMTVKVVFEATNPGLWAFHCHNLYHLDAGMFTTVVYDGFS